jgi:hypothetical protein
VKPTIEDPLREEWTVVQAEVRDLVAREKDAQAEKVVRAFHERLCKIRVLDPACGSGNFLYVTLDVFKRLESEVLNLVAELSPTTILQDAQNVTVTPAQFLGIEIKPWAKEIAELVLWIGYLQWQFRTRGNVAPREPVLRDYKNIERRDAVLAYDREEVALDESGKPITRWDGITMKKSSVTGEDVPDESARAALMHFVNPRKAVWPDADFIVGNPPYIGVRRLKTSIGDEYVEALRSAYPDVPETCDYVMYWWDKAAKAVAPITTPAKAIKWPAKLPAQIALVRNLVTQGDASWSIEEVASQFKGARRDTVESVLDSLAALGLLVAYGANGTRRWKVPARAAE